jgi:hypothetical protein
MEDQSVQAETPEVETETTEVPQDLNETTSETEMSEVATSEKYREEQPAEEAKTESRAANRIKQLNRKAKEAEERAEYWENLARQAPEIPQVESEDGTFTADQVADVILAKQSAQEVEKQRDAARKALVSDIRESVEKYPELQSDDDLAQMVYGYAVQKRISLQSAADQVISRIKAQEAKAAKIAQQKTTASQAIRTGVSSPQGGTISDGQLPPPDVSSMSEEEKAANWSKIVASY